MQLRVAFGFGQEQELAKLHVKMSKATTEDLKAFAKIVEVERGGTKVLLLCGSDGATGSLWCNVPAYKARLHATDQTGAPEHNAPKSHGDGLGRLEVGAQGGSECALHGREGAFAFCSLTSSRA